MDNKCNKFESLFIFSDEANLKKHIDECEDCRKEFEIQQKVSSLIDEVKLHYYSKNRSKRRIRAACAVIFLVISVFSAGIAMTNEDLTEALMYGDTLTAEELGFPVDSYGLLMVDEE